MCVTGVAISSLPPAIAPPFGLPPFFWPRAGSSQELDIKSATTTTPPTKQRAQDTAILLEIPANRCFESNRCRNARQGACRRSVSYHNEHRVGAGGATAG